MNFAVYKKSCLDVWGNLKIIEIEVLVVLWLKRWTAES